VEEPQLQCLLLQLLQQLVLVLVLVLLSVTTLNTLLVLKYRY
jgi:hypothetical protein